MSGPDPLLAAARGLAVFPLPAGQKQPAPRGWQRSATADPAQLRAWWPSGANIGVGCWRSNVVVLDLDVPGGGHRTAVRGADTLAAVCATAGEPWPHTLTVATPSGGLHLYFAAPGNATIGSTSGGTSPLGEGIDTRGPGAGGRGGYVVGPGSVVGGRCYSITVDAPIAPLPWWLTHMLASGPGAEPPMPLELVRSSRALWAVADTAREVCAVVTGRHHTRWPDQPGIDTNLLTVTDAFPAALDELHRAAFGAPEEFLEAAAGPFVAAVVDASAVPALQDALAALRAALDERAAAEAGVAALVARNRAARGGAA